KRLIQQSCLQNCKPKIQIMKRFFLIFCAFYLTGFAFSCGELQSISGISGSPANDRPTQYEINSALKQALEIGIKQGVKQVSAKDGFFKNSLIKVLFPPEAQKVENTLRQVGLGSLTDKVILSLNRAAEDASKEALPI